MKKLTWICIIIIGLFSILNLSGQHSQADASGQVLSVGGNGVNSYSTIQEAITNAQDGDTIEIQNGHYHENIVIDKSIRLMGSDREDTIIDGDLLGDVVTISGNDVEIHNMTIIRSAIDIENDSIAYAGITVTGHTIYIDNCITRNNDVGIIALNSSSVAITNSSVTSNRGGIDFYQTENCSIAYCSITNNYELFGISLRESSNIIIHYNNISSNIPFGLVLASSSFNNVYTNIFAWNNYSGVYVLRTLGNPCKGNVFYQNNFVENHVYNAVDKTAESQWNNSVIGNYWSDYDEEKENATDQNNDGFIDTPYGIPPLMITFDNYPQRYPFSITVGYTPKNHTSLILSITSPQGNNQTVEGTVRIAGSVNSSSSAASVTAVRLKIDEEGSWQSANGTDQWEYLLDTTQYQNGVHVVTVRAFSDDGSSEGQTMYITVDNPTNEAHGTPGFLLGLFFVVLFFLLVRMRITKQ